MKSEKIRKFIPILIVVLVIGVLLFLTEKSVPTKEIVTENTEEQNIDTTDNKNAEAPSIITTQGEVGKLFVKAVEQQAKGDFAGAKITLDQALKLQPNDPYITSSYAALYFAMKDYPNAMIWIDKAISIKNDINFWYQKIDITKAKTSNNLIETEKTYQEAIAKTSTNINMVTAYASWLGQIGRKQDAIKQWEKAIEIYPQGKVQFQKEIDLLK